MTLMIECDADCTRAGWVEYIAAGGEYDLHVSIAPDADLDGTLYAFNHDEQEVILMYGQLFSFERVEA